MKPLYLQGLQMVLMLQGFSWRQKCYCTASGFNLELVSMYLMLSKIHFAINSFSVPVVL